MVAEKNNFSSNAHHNFARSRVISKCKNDKIFQTEKVPVPRPF